MKTYKHLFEKLISEDNILNSLITAKQGDKSEKTKKHISLMQDNIEYWVPKLREIVKNYHNAPHTPKEIYDGITRKKRTIIVPTVIELVVQHMIINVLKPIFLKGSYEHSYAAFPERGGHKGKRMLALWIKRDPKNTKYCLKVDIRHFFDSIDKKILKTMLARIISEKQFLDLLFTIIDVTDHGIPLGFYTSQWFANWYLMYFDHYVKEDLGVHYYMRYMDDMVFLNGDKEQLHKVRELISLYLQEKLSLELKHTYAISIIGTDKSNFVDFMGFRFYSNRTLLRRSIMLKCTRKAKTIWDKKHITNLTVYDARQINSYKGWIFDSDTYNVYCRRIRPCVNFRSASKIVSRYDRRENTRCGTNLKVA